MLRRTCCAFLIIASPWLPAADVVTLDSGDRHVALLELYTSEGCSSCPRADRWLSALTEDERLWKQVVPVAFHVDYWDYIGWRDRFAAPAFTQRQRTYQRQGQVGTVYTPGLVLDGKEWRSWFVLPVLRVGEREAPGRLRLRVAGDTIDADFSPLEGSSHEAVRLHVALLGFGLHTEVRGGENKGRRLTHDFVVLDYHQHAMAANGERHAARVTVARSREPARRLGLAAWVSRGADQRPLQAVGGWLD